MTTTRNDATTGITLGQIATIGELCEATKQDVHEVIRRRYGKPLIELTRDQGAATIEALEIQNTVRNQREGTRCTG